MMFLESSHGRGRSEYDQNSPAAHWFQQLSKQLALPSKPKAVLVITAHWETTNIVQISGQKQHTELLYDYHGFPAEAYQLQYNPPGDVNLANRVKSLLEQAGIRAKLNDRRNFDHGVFVPMKLIYPDADIPIVSMSILDNLSPAQHLAIGRALAPLRKEQILIIGSGSAVHGRATQQQADAFMNQLIEVVTKSNEHERENELLNWKQQLPYAEMNHGREEHLMPLHVVVGAAGSDRGELINPNVNKSQAAFKFGY